MTKKDVSLETLDDIVFTGRQIEKINKLFQADEYREKKREKLRKEPKLAGRSFEERQLKNKKQKRSKILRRRQPWKYKKQLYNLECDIAELQKKLQKKIDKD